MDRCRFTINPLLKSTDERNSFTPLTLALGGGTTKTDFTAVGIGTVRALVQGVARHLTTVLEVLLGILILGSLGTFFLYVPILPVAAAVTIMLALILMFILGVQTGGRRIRVLRRKNASGSRPAEWHSLNRTE